MRGTWRTETFDGTVSEGTFNGTMNMDPEVLTWDCMIRGKGVSGPSAGTLIWCQNVKTEPGPGGLATADGHDPGAARVVTLALGGRGAAPPKGAP